jgi:putative endonuclease
MSRAAGADAERLAAAYLERRGLTILETNWTCKGGELDLVCDDGGTLVFVEVRARRDDRHGSALETVGALKRRRLVHAARNYLMRRRIGERACRFDVIAIEGGGPSPTVTHIENAFDA